nr:MAG TPA: hypothetical protein [Caudoviricetes sp.]
MSISQPFLSCKLDIPTTFKVPNLGVKGNLGNI